MTDDALAVARDDRAAGAQKQLAKEAELDAAVARGELRRVRVMRRKQADGEPALSEGICDPVVDEGSSLALTVRGQTAVSDDDSETEEFEYVPVTDEERMQQVVEARASAHWSRGNDLLKRSATRPGGARAQDDRSHSMLLHEPI